MKRDKLIGAVLLVVFHLTLVALTSEEAGFAADRSEQLAAETTAYEALNRQSGTDMMNLGDIIDEASKKE